MAIVDAQGRLFGRLNLVDAVLLALLAGLLPLGVAAYALFRERPARLVSVTPEQVPHAAELRVAVTGENLRPYMRVSAGAQQGLDFIFKSTTEAEVPFLNLPPGEYDLILYDHARERSRLPKALTVGPGPLPSTQMIAVGAFGNLDQEKARKIAAGLALSGIGEVIRTGPPAPDRTPVFAGASRVGVQVPDALQVPAVVRLRCGVRALQGRPDCVVRDAALAPNVLLLVPTPFGDTPFLVDQVLSIEPVQQIEMQVRFSGDPAVLSLIRPGDADRGGTSNELAAGAVIVSVGQLRRLSDTTGERLATVRADVQPAEGTWLYDSATLRAGGFLPMRTRRYILQGLVTGLPAAPAPGATNR
jgi:hypothetical protein